MEAFAMAGIETGASADDVKYVRRLGKAVPIAGSVIVFNELKQKGFSDGAAAAGTAANEAAGSAIVATGAFVGSIEPGLGTLVGGGIAWGVDQIFEWSDAAGVKAAQEYELRNNGKKVEP